MKIGVSSYSFSQYMNKTGCSYTEICNLAKEIGFDGIEFIDLNPKKESCSDIYECAKIINDHCKSIGLPVIAYTVGANLLLQDPEAEVERLCRCVDVTELLGASIMRHDVCRELPKKHLYNYRDAINDMAPYINKVTEYAKEKGIRTCTENHGFLFQSPERVEELILAVGNENYGWLCDIGNFLCADEDIINGVSVAAPYTFHAHVKDFLWKSGSEDCPVGFFMTRGRNHIRGTIAGHGVVPIRNCIGILKNAGYDSWLSLEFEGPEDNIPALRSGLEYLKRLV